MDNKRYRLIWAAGLVGLGLSALLMAVHAIAGGIFPDALVRILGMIILIELPVVGYTTIKLHGVKKHSK